MLIKLFFHRCWALWILSGGLGLVWGSQAALQAQTVPRPQIPSPILPAPSIEPEPLLPPPQELLQPPGVTVPEVPLRVPEFSDTTETITVTRFQVLGSTVFTPEELAQVTAPYTGRPITFTELLQARSAITQLYVDQGYVTSGAYIPANQDITAGVVTVQVLEGRLEGIEVQGNQRLRSRYIRDRLKLATGEPLNVNRLVTALQLLQLDPLIRSISAELAAGTAPGTSLLQVQVEEAQSLNLQVRLDNQRSPSIGSFQRGFQLTQANLFGYGDGLQFAYTNTDGSNDLAASYVLPVNARNGTVSVAYNHIWSRIVEAPFDRLDIRGISRDLNLSFRQPIIQTPTQELALGLTAVRRESDTSLKGIPFALSPGANEKGQTRVSEIQFFQEWIKRQRQSVLAARSEFGLGLGILDATVNPTAPDSRFFAWRGQAQWVRVFAPDLLLLLRSNVQLSDRALLPLEQFGIGGVDSVRGYRQDLLLVDNGVSASAEARIPLYRLPRQQGVLQIAPFVDFASGWNHRDSQPIIGPRTLASIGLGLRWQWRDRVTVRLDWGYPLVAVDTNSNSLQDQGLYFAVIVNPF